MTTETATTFRVGDRVRIMGANSLGIATGIVFERDKSSDDNHVSFSRGISRWVHSEALELVERAHYATAGIPVLVLTLEILEALEWLREAGQMPFTDSLFDDIRTKHRHLEVTGSAIAAALATAQKENPKA
jgi:hypothetical protein